MSATVVQSKSGRARQVPLTAETRAACWRGVMRPGLCSVLVRPANRRPRPPSGVVFARLASTLGLHGVSHHVLRHTGATVMVRNGVSLRAVQTIGGWSSLRMLDRYAHVNDRNSRAPCR